MVNYGGYATAVNGVCTDPAQMANACPPVKTYDGWSELEKGMEELVEKMGWLIMQAEAIDNHLFFAPINDAKPKKPEPLGFFGRMRDMQETLLQKESELEVLLTRIGTGRCA